MSDGQNVPQTPQTFGGMLDRLPVWVQVGLVIYNIAGLPTCILVYLALQNAGVIPNPVEKAIAALQQSDETIMEHLEEFKGAVLQQGTFMQEIGKQMARDAERKQMWCVMKAQSDQEKKACFPSSKE